MIVSIRFSPCDPCSCDNTLRGGVFLECTCNNAPTLSLPCSALVQIYLGEILIFSENVGPGTTGFSIPSAGTYQVVITNPNTGGVTKQTVNLPSNQAIQVHSNIDSVDCNCFCQNFPQNLHMTSANESCNYGMYKSCTFSLIDQPSWFPIGTVRSKVYISTASFLDVFDNAYFYYYLSCYQSSMSLIPLYPDWPNPGATFEGGSLYTWDLSANGNTCKPLNLRNGGTPFLAPDCDNTNGSLVTISE